VTTAEPRDPREPLLAELARYLARHPDERIAVDHVIQFVRANPDCFERSCVPGHVTGSAWILSPDRRAFLLAHHAKLDRWLQCGGHADGDPDTAAVALREAREESGMEGFEFAQRDPRGPIIFDVDVHVFPARGSDPAHLHHDVRYLLIAAPGQVPRVSGESNALRWFPAAEDHQELAHESLARLVRKARAWLAS
jgi:8-oxo-dGTP pyrophosphatase MutT (NUDIX family)